MATTISPNMSLPIPVVGQEPGPQYATDVNNSLTIVDQHNHSAGSGVQINPAGININSALTMNGQSLYTIGNLTFQPVSVDQGIGSLYEKGVDLYYEDGSGNVIRITQSGSVSGASGTITGLPSGTASASFAAATFTFQSATNTPANVAGASFIFGNNVANSKTLTLQPPNALGSNYTLTLPTLPLSLNSVTIDASGNIGHISFDDVGSNMTSVGANAINNSITITTSSTVAPEGGLLISPSSGTFTTTSNTPVGVIQGYIVTSGGKPVRITLQSDGSNGTSFLLSNNVGGLVLIVRNGTTVATYPLFPNIVFPSSMISFIDEAPGAGTTNYLLQVATSSAGEQVVVQNVTMTAQEI